MTWWLVTWSTYASWLPGDLRGFQTWRGREYVPPPKRFAKPGQATYDPGVYRERLEESQSKSGNRVLFSPQERTLIARAVVEEIDRLPMTAAILAVSATHCHLLARFGALSIRKTVGILKGEATKELRRHGWSDKRIWGRECHMRSKQNGREFATAFRYIRNHRREDGVVYVWPAFIEIANELEKNDRTAIGLGLEPKHQ